MRSDGAALTIGKVAKASGVGVETIRFYEREGLLPRPDRTASGYRNYPAETARRLRFIRRARDLGFTLPEIGELLELLELTAHPSADAATVRARAVEKLADVEERIRTLDRMRSALAHLVERCEGRGSLADCPILDALEEEGPSS